MISRMFSAPHVHVTSCRCVSLKTAEHPPVISTQTGVGSKRGGGFISLTGALGNVRQDLCQHIALLRSRQPMRQGQRSTIQTELTEQSSRDADAHTPMCSDRGKSPCKANPDAGGGWTAPLTTAKCILEKPKVLNPAWHRRGCGTEWQTGGVWCCLLFIQKDVNRNRGRKIISEEQHLGLDLSKHGRLFLLHYRIQKHTRIQIYFPN